MHHSGASGSVFDNGLALTPTTWIADGVLTEDCRQFATCARLHAFLGAKAVFDVEYTLPTASFCAADVAASMSGTRFAVALDGSLRSPCQ